MVGFKILFIEDDGVFGCFEIIIDIVFVVVIVEEVEFDWFFDILFFFLGCLLE